MVDEDITIAWARFHELLTSEEVHHLMTQSPLRTSSGESMNDVCAMKRLVAQFASIYLGYEKLDRVR